MMPEAKSWLPAQAFSQARLCGLLGPVTADWSRHWFPQAKASLVQAVQGDWPSMAKEARWRAQSEVGAIVFTPLGQAAVAGAMLGIHLPQTLGQPNDRLLIEVLAARALDDLLERFGKLAGRAGKPGVTSSLEGIEDCRWWDLSIGELVHPLRFGLEHSLLIEMIKRALPRPRRSELTALGEAVAKERVSLTAGFGTSTLTLGELHGLGAGDVLILSSDIAEPIDVLVNGASSIFAGRLNANEGRPSLVLEDVR